MSMKQNAAEKWMGPSDQLVDSECDVPVAAHVLTPRWGYTHHGIYVGAGRVVHYGGLIRGLRRRPIEEVPLSQFAQGRPIAFRVSGSFGFDPEEVVRRARIRLGEDRYDVLNNNCEHFCEWCVTDEHRSYQVDAHLTRWVGGLFGMIKPLLGFEQESLELARNKRSDPTDTTLSESGPYVNRYQGVRDTNVQSRIQSSTVTFQTHLET